MNMILIIDQKYGEHWVVQSDAPKDVVVRIIGEEFDKSHDEENYMGDIQDNLCRRIANETVWSGAIITSFEWGVDKISDINTENPLNIKIMELRSEINSLKLQNKMLKNKYKTI